MHYFKNALPKFSKQILASVFFLFAFMQAYSQKKQKCFEDDGLKYKTVIHINFLSTTQVSGNVTSEEYDSQAKLKTDFTGIISGRMLKIKFNGNRPVVGAATQWLDKPWTIKKTKGKETLCIIFYSKNYNTQKWSNTTYEFIPCQ